MEDCDGFLGKPLKLCGSNLSVDKSNHQNVTGWLGGGSNLSVDKSNHHNVTGWLGQVSQPKTSAGASRQQCQESSLPGEARCGSTGMSGQTVAGAVLHWAGPASEGKTNWKQTVDSIFIKPAGFNIEIVVKKWWLWSHPDMKTITFIFLWFGFQIVGNIWTTHGPSIWLNLQGKLALQSPAAVCLPEFNM